MTQQQLDQLVAHATGEDLDEIQRRGFSFANPAEANFDPEPYDLSPATIEWDGIKPGKRPARRKRRRQLV